MASGVVVENDREAMDIVDLGVLFRGHAETLCISNIETRRR